MVGGDMFKGLFVGIFILGALVVGLSWGAIEIFSDDSIRSDQPITPRLELVVKDNVVDTVYVYERP